MSYAERSLVGSVFERKTSTVQSVPSPRFANTPGSGFPAVQHRSKSAFARAREEEKSSSNIRPTTVPLVLPARPAEQLRDLEVDLPTTDDVMRLQISEDNERQVENMTEEEREQERREVVEQLGSGVGDLLERVRAARSRKATKAPTIAEDNPVQKEEAPEVSREIPIVSPLLGLATRRNLSRVKSLEDFGKRAPPILVTSSTRPSSPSRGSRKLRFAALTPDDVHVYESALALPPPPDAPDPSIVSLGTFKENRLPRKRPLSPQSPQTQPEEGTPEYIRRRYFPNVPADDPSVSWMKPSPPNSEPVLLRFDLTGAPIPAEISATLPSHLGLHHHADGTTQDTLLMIYFCSGIARRRTAAMNEKGGVGVRAIQVVWECLVGWDALFDAECAELDLAPAIMSTLQVPNFLTQSRRLFTQAYLPPESLAQLLSIVYRLSQESNVVAKSIMKTPRLLPAILQFLLTPIPPPSDSPLPNPVALQCLIVLASSSRTNAMALCEPADALLRFITILPPISPFPEPLATTLLTETLRLYTTLASYGLYSHITTSAASYFASLSTYVVSSSSRPLKVAWAGLVESWIVCATDPHHTTPPHDILWSQVTSWGWGVEVLQLRQGIAEGEAEVWAAIWSAASAWLEGARVNGIKGGEGERAETLNAIQDDFNKGVEDRVVKAALEALRTELAQIYETPPSERYQHLRSIGIHARALSSAVRLWLACTPTAHAAAPIGAPPFSLPFAELSSFCAVLVSHSIWSFVTKGVEHATCRSLATFLAYFHRLSRHIPGTSADLWVAQGLTILERQLPGEEEHAFHVLEPVLAVLTTQFLGTMAPPGILEKGGWGVIEPFLDHAIRPSREVYIGPSDVTPESIIRCTTLRLPSSTSSSSILNEHRTTGLPLSRVWLTTPIDHLLRSGSSPVFKALPSSWDASEVDVIRTSLLLVKATQEILLRYSLKMVFACMKHQEHPSPATGDEEEVFRDLIVSKLMSNVLAPFTLGAASASSPSSKLPDIDLDQTSLPFLGSGTPFYQFYTDFLGLYDAISFSHPIFASLLLPPLALTYPIDYRRLLWGDFAHVLLVAGDLRDFLYPVEKGEMIGKYVSALLQGSVDGFLRLVAVHHGVEAEHEDMAKKLLKMVVENGDGRTVRGEAWIADRVEFAQQALGSELHERLQGVFYG
ncbi:uncharacterized protein EDB91DRAFT_1135674 [Suillus paluster]|uniref:uncharacterized protein n=1 Tax=Suillus paluster TaxID=48578 RepID=UPI001B85C2E0|nr:uncharacterized protein EDB91DRAFT_1135674 [Suillus paluster]KAG1739496.1 hypothetical protein EDB91DRAFT_1135674 [Suillus paluster]